MRCLPCWKRAMPRRTPPEIRTYITENCAGKSRKELADAVNALFDTRYDAKRIGSLLKDWGLKTGSRKGVRTGTPTTLFPADVSAYITENFIGCGWAEMTRRVNERFETRYTRDQIKNFYARKKLDSGLTGRFERGHEPWNAGKKIGNNQGSAKTQFKSGILPQNTKPIGYERVNRDGYTEIKVRLRKSRPGCNDNFVLKHRWLWEQENGPIPDGYVVAFKDGDKTNFDLSNLVLITKAQNAVMNKAGLRSKEPEYMETSLLLADLKHAVHRAKKKQKGEGASGK